jgi:hypothetical protein
MCDVPCHDEPLTCARRTMGVMRCPVVPPRDTWALRHVRRPTQGLSMQQLRRREQCDGARPPLTNGRIGVRPGTLKNVPNGDADLPPINGVNGVRYREIVGSYDFHQMPGLKAHGFQLQAAGRLVFTERRPGRHAAAGGGPRSVSSGRPREYRSAGAPGACSGSAPRADSYERPGSGRPRAAHRRRSGSG